MDDETRISWNELSTGLKTMSPGSTFCWSVPRLELTPGSLEIRYYRVFRERSSRRDLGTDTRAQVVDVDLNTETDWWMPDGGELLLQG